MDYTVFLGHPDIASIRHLIVTHNSLAQPAAIFPYPIFTTLCIWLLLVIASGSLAAKEIGTPIELSPTHKDGSIYMGVRILGALKLDRGKIDGLKPRELSGLAWDADEGMLYALSDDGYVMHLRPNIVDGLLTGVEAIAAHVLRDPEGVELSGANADSEGLDIINQANGVRGDSELIVTLEGEPRVMRYRPDGYVVGQYRLPNGLAHLSDYRSDNSGLEGVVLHPVLGLLVAPEKALAAAAEQTFSIYDLKGNQWQYAPMDPEHSSLVDIEAGPAGSLLVLERKYISIFRPVVFAVRKLTLSGSEDRMAEVKDLFVLRTDEDWLLDNFEGLAQHEESRYFMISDDEENIFQKTLLVYFEVLGDDPVGPKQ